MTQDLPVDVANGVLAILVATGRTVPASLWVDAFLAKAAEARDRALPHHFC